MKQITLITFMSLLALAVMAQKVDRKSVSVQKTLFPTLPVENIEKMKVLIHFPDASVNQDTLQKYMGSMDFMYRDDAERMAKMKEYSYRPLQMVNSDDYDILLEVAFGEPKFGSKELKHGSCILNKDPECKTYYYWVSHELPTIVKVSDKNGKTLDIWKEHSKNTNQFGNRQLESNLGEGKSGISINTMKWTSKEMLDAQYAKMGATLVNRAGILKQLKKVIDTYYPKIYFKDT